MTTATGGTAVPSTVDAHHVWITRHDDGVVAAARDAATGPLAGWTVAVKDNVDVAGFPTTAGCPSYAYAPPRTAPAVQRLVDAGAVVVGKTNLDQFATGLVGTRSPYGPVESPVAPGRVAGGSSSGSAAAVALGWVDLGVATDTAGSGRVPAAFCGIVGLKGTRGWVPTAGVVPACPSFDCTTVFAGTVTRAALALRTMAGTGSGPAPEAVLGTTSGPVDASGAPLVPGAAVGPGDASGASTLPGAGAAPVADTASGTVCRDRMCRPRPAWPARPVRRIGVPAASVLDGCDDRTRHHFAAAVHRAASRGLAVHEVDLTAYLDAGSLLYGGALVAERTASVGEFLARRPPDADPAVADVIAGGAAWSAVDLAADRARLERLGVAAAAVWDTVDAVLLPVAPFHPTLDEVAADPLGVNSRLGRFTAGCNLVDWCAAAFPVPTDDALPFGVQLLGPAWSDPAVWAAAAAMTGEDPTAVATLDEGPDRLLLAVCGAHLAGEPLNHQLVDRGAVLVRRTPTAPSYRMVVLDGAVPKPGLYRAGGGAAVEVEVWSLDAAAFGRFVAEVPAPLAIGAVELADGASVPGFLCDANVAAAAPDITAWGGWRAWRAQA